MYSVLYREGPLKEVPLYETDHRIHYIDQLMKFDYGTAATNVVTTFVNTNGQVLRVSRKSSI